MDECLACDLMSGKKELPGGRIYETTYWVVEHCIGPFGVGTLIVKPKRHCLHVWELDEDEAREVGPLLRRVAATIRAIVQPDQVYVCLWSHAGWEPVHIHFVVQPAWNDLRHTHDKPGPYLQTDMAAAGAYPTREAVEAFAATARAILQSVESESNLGKAGNA